MIEDKLHRKPRVSVIVLDYNGQRFWPELLAALSAQSFRDFELVVVENGGPLELPERLGEHPVRVLRGRGNVGFAEGVNWGVSQARGEFLALLNNDAVPEPQWLDSLVDRMQASPMAGAICSKVLFYDRYLDLEIEVPTFSPQAVGNSDDARDLGVLLRMPQSTVSRFSRQGTYGFEDRGGVDWVWTKGRARVRFPEPKEKVLQLRIASAAVQRGTIARLRIEKGEWVECELSGGEQSLRMEVPEGACFDVVNSVGNSFDRDWGLVEEGLYERDGPRFSRVRELEMGSACSLLLRRSALDGEPFDPEFFAYFEDSDLSYRLRRAGWSILVEPGSVVRHHGSATSGVLSVFSIFQSIRNHLWIIAKYAPLRVVLRAMIRDLWNPDRPGCFGKEGEFTLARLKREARLGFFKRLWRRLCEAD